MTIVIPEAGEPPETAALAFAAGVATAEAEAAGEQAQEAETAAEAATVVAQAALEVAQAGESDRWAHREAVADLTEQVRALREEVAELRTPVAPAVTEDDLAPEALAHPEIPEDHEEGGETPEPTRRKGYGSDRWFGRKG